MASPLVCTFRRHSFSGSAYRGHVASAGDCVVCIVGAGKRSSSHLGHGAAARTTCKAAAIELADTAARACFLSHEKPNGLTSETRLKSESRVAFGKARRLSARHLVTLCWRG